MSIEKIASRKQRPFEKITSMLALFALSLFPVIFLILHNYDLVGKDDVLISVGVTIIHTLVLLVISLLVFRSLEKAALAATIASLPLMVFRTIEGAIYRLIPSLYYWHILILILSVIAGFWYLIAKHRDTVDIIKINQIIAALAIILILVNVVPLVLSQSTKNESQTEDLTSASELIVQSESIAISHAPNIYLYIFDEYSGPEASLRYANFSNEAFYTHLESLGFNNSKSSRNYTISTTVEIPNLLNLALEITEENRSESMKDKVLQSPYLFSLLKELGYSFNLINDQGNISIPDSWFSYSFAPQGEFQKEESVLTSLIDNSVYYPLRKISSQSRIVQVEHMFTYAAESSTLSEANLFTLGYFMFPHLPWVVDEHGNEIAAGERHDWKNSNIYLGQLKYANSKILNMVETIIHNDPGAIIILQSDHAYRQPFHLRDLYGVEYEDMTTESRMMRNILNSVYFRGETIEIEGLSGINTLRTVLDKQFNLNLGLIIEPK